MLLWSCFHDVRWPWFIFRKSWRNVSTGFLQRVQIFNHTIVCDPSRRLSCRCIFIIPPWSWPYSHWPSLLNLTVVFFTSLNWSSWDQELWMIWVHAHSFEILLVYFCFLRIKLFKNNFFWNCTFCVSINILGYYSTWKFS